MEETGGEQEGGGERGLARGKEPLPNSIHQVHRHQSKPDIDHARREEEGREVRHEIGDEASAAVREVGDTCDSREEGEVEVREIGRVVEDGLEFSEVEGGHERAELKHLEGGKSEGRLVVDEHEWQAIADCGQPQEEGEADDAPEPRLLPP